MPARNLAVISQGTKASLTETRRNNPNFVRQIVKWRVATVSPTRRPIEAPSATDTTEMVPARTAIETAHRMQCEEQQEFVAEQREFNARLEGLVAENTAEIKGIRDDIGDLLGRVPGRVAREKSDESGRCWVSR